MCLDDQILNTYLDGELAEPWKSQVEEHLSYCNSCKSRYNSLKELRSCVKDAALTDQEIKSHQDRVLSVLEKNYLSKSSKKKFFKRDFRFSFTQLAGIAAAFVIVLVGSWSVLGSSKIGEIPVPETDSAIDIAKIVPVRASDSSSTSKAIDEYSVNEIVQILQDRGWDVSLTLKGVSVPEIVSIVSEEKVVVAYTNGTYITNNGNAYNKDGLVFATGLKVEDGNVFALDGQEVFSNLTKVELPEEIPVSVFTPVVLPAAEVQPETEEPAPEV